MTYGDPPESFRRWIINYSDYSDVVPTPVVSGSDPPLVPIFPTSPERACSTNGPLCKEDRVSIHVDKSTHRIVFVDEDERFVTVNIEPKDSPA